ADNDTIVDDGVDSTIDGGTGNDLLILHRSGDTRATTLTFTPGSSTAVALPDGTTFKNIEQLQLTTGGGDNTITFVAPAFNDALNQGSSWTGGGAGTNTAIVDFSSDTIGVVSASAGAEGEILARDFFGHSPMLSLFDIEAVQITGGSAADILAGLAGNDILIGNGGDDSLSGSDGDDILEGGAGNDTLDGGAGTDTARFSASRSAYLISFDPAQQTYTVTDERTASPDGTDTLSGIEKFAFADGTYTFDANGNANSQSVVHPDGTTTLTLFDTTNAAPWASLATTTDLQGSLASQAITTDAGTKWVNSFDTAGTQPWQWTTDSFDAAGNLLTEVRLNDDGSHTLTLNDVANQYAWSTATLTFDANWNQTGLSGTNDNGTHTIGAFQVAVALDTAPWYASPYDPNQGHAIAITLAGGANTDLLFGGAGADTLSGGGGNDVLSGGAGDDTLTGGAGNDRFAFHDGDGRDTITDFTAGDTIALQGYGIAGFAALQPLMSQSGSDTVITFDPDNTITLHNVTMGSLGAGDFVFG
ncbi:MAG TPA: calcium-binding protein, partial [Rhizomicrobium sp.]|nr:calcium-binding protein [Rhizomicrobium sp.]